MWNSKGCEGTKKRKLEGKWRNGEDKNDGGNKEEGEEGNKKEKKKRRRYRYFDNDGEY